MALSKAELEELKAKWYAKLKKSGFDDIEADEDNLKVWSSDKFGRNKGLSQNGGGEAKLEYYRLAGWFLNDYKFENDSEKQIWEWYSEGSSCQDIVKLLRTRVTRTNKERGWRVLKQVETMLIENRRTSLNAANSWNIIKEIKTWLSKQKRMRIEKDVIWKIINRLEGIMKAMYLEGQK